MVVRKYHELKFGTYKPKKRVKVRKEEAVPLVLDVGGRFSTLGGLTGFFVSSFLMSIKSFFRVRKRMRKIMRRFEKTIDLSGEK